MCEVSVTILNSACEQKEVLSVSTQNLWAGTKEPKIIGKCIFSPFEEETMQPHKRTSCNTHGQKHNLLTIAKKEKQSQKVPLISMYAFSA